MKRRCGFTMIELLVVLVLLGLTATATSVAFRAPPIAAAGWRSRLTAARHTAITTGRPVSGWVDSVGRYTAHPGGSVVSDSATGHTVGGAHAR